MITIVDYGLGNLSSIKNMLRRMGFPSLITGDPEEISRAEKIVLPGVGAFDNGMRNIREKGLETVLRQKALIERVPVLGICLGMQLLCHSSEEGVEPGLGWVDGAVVRIVAEGNGVNLKVPHMGWNTVSIENECALTKGFLPEMRFYFVHSYHAVCDRPGDVVLATDYGTRMVAALRSGNIMGTQFHPEKSHKYGMIVLRNFAEM